MKTIYEKFDLLPHFSNYADATVICADNILLYLQSKNGSLETLLRASPYIIPPTKYSWVEFTPSTKSGLSRIAFMVDNLNTKEINYIEPRHYQDIFADKVHLLWVSAMGNMIDASITPDKIELPPNPWVLTNRKGHVAKRGNKGYWIINHISPYDDFGFESECGKEIFAALLLTFSMIHNQEVTLEANLTYIKSTKKTIPILTATVKENVKHAV